MRTRRAANRKHRSHLAGKQSQIRFLRDVGVLDKLQRRTERQNRRLRREHARDKISGKGQEDR